MSESLAGGSADVAGHPERRGPEAAGGPEPVPAADLRRSQALQILLLVLLQQQQAKEFTVYHLSIACQWTIPDSVACHLLRRFAFIALKPSAPFHSSPAVSLADAFGDRAAALVQACDSFAAAGPAAAGRPTEWQPFWLIVLRPGGNRKLQKRVLEVATVAHQAAMSDACTSSPQKFVQPTCNPCQQQAIDMIRLLRRQ